MVNKKNTTNMGFTLIEMMIVVAVIGVLAAIAYPNYQRYVIKTKRTAMMTDLQNIGSQIQAQKLAKGSYANVNTTSLVGNYPQQGTALYKVSITPNPLTADWVITADPTDATIQPSSMMKNDGILTFNSQGIKCKGSVCGKVNEWNQ